jgi:hypothetical protein
MNSFNIGDIFGKSFDRFFQFSTAGIRLSWIRDDFGLDFLGIFGWFQARLENDSSSVWRMTSRPVPRVGDVTKKDHLDGEEARWERCLRVPTT